jgi:hypothetical protein
MKSMIILAQQGQRTWRRRDLAKTQMYRLRFLGHRIEPYAATAAV